MKGFLLAGILTVSGLGFLSTGNAAAQEILSGERAEGERLGAATGYFSRSRSMLLTAIREFNRGVDYADPSSLIHVTEFRETVLDRIEELERVLDPQPQMDANGVTYHSHSKIRTPAYALPSTQPRDEEERVMIEKADPEDLKYAVKHFTACRSLLQSAVREFDAGLRYANPQVLVDVHEWRNNVIDRTEDLERVIAPKPRETETGVAFQPDSRLLNPDF